MTKEELLEKKLAIATKALKKIIRDYEINGIVYLFVKRAKQAIKEIDLVGTSVSLADNKIQANTLADNKLQAKEEV
jgi:hypothetical protein